MSQTTSKPAFHELVIPVPLWEFLSFCEIHCTARCCEDKAFEQDHLLIQRKVDELDDRGKHGIEQFEKARTQLRDVIAQIQAIAPHSEFDQVLVWTRFHSGSFKFQLNLDIAPAWFLKWKEIFDKVNRTAQIDKRHE